MKPFELYRYFNADGSSKDWAICNESTSFKGGGTYTVRWGKTGQRLPQKLTKPVDNRNTVHDLIRSKIRKGYVLIGNVMIDDGGNISNVPPASSKPVGEDPHPQDEPRIYWRIKIPAHLPESPDLEFFRGMTRGFADSILRMYPEYEWISAIKSRYRDISLVKSEAGFWLKEDGVFPFLLLMAMKKHVPGGITISLSHEDSVEISDHLKLETQALSFFGTDLESIRSIAEILGLLAKRLDLSMIAPEHEDFYF